MRTETVITLPYSEFEDLVNEHVLPLTTRTQRYEYPDEEEMGNDTSRLYTISGECDEDDTEDILNGKFQYRAWPLLDFLVQRGVMPAGKYLVEVSW